MRNSTRRFRVCPSKPSFLAAIGAALLAIAGAPGCHKREAPAGATATTSTTPAATPVPVEVAPVIHETAAAGQAPFAGLAEPRGAAVDDRSRVWITDFGHSRMTIFDSSGGYLGGWGGVRGNGRFELQEPAAVAIHGADVYVADTWNGRVQHFTTGGEFRGTSVAGLYGPRGVAVGADGTLWISDSGNNRLAVCPAGTCANPPRYVGKAGSGAGEMVSPIGIATGPSGNVYVADMGNHRIQVFGSDGRFLKSIAVAAWNGPMEAYLEADGKENLYISASERARVEELDRSGHVVKTWDADDEGKKFVRPTGLALDRKNGVLYVMNSGNSTVVALKLARK